MKRNCHKLLSTSSNYIGFGFIHYFFSSLGQTFLISVYVKYFVEAATIDNEAFSWIYTSATLSGAFLLPFIGGLVDEVTLRYFSLANGMFFMTFLSLIANVALFQKRKFPAGTPVYPNIFIAAF